MLQAQDLIDAVSVGIYCVDRDGAIAFMNATATRLLGWDPEQSLGRSHHELLRHAGPNSVPYSENDCPLCQAIRSGATLSAPTENFYCADGTYLPVEYNVAPFLSSKDGAASVITFRDGSEQVNLNLQLLRAQKLESIGQLAAGIAHEINTPIQYVGDNNRFLERAFQQLMPLLDEVTLLVAEAQQGPPNQNLLDRVCAAANEAEWDYYRTEIPDAIAQSLDGIDRVARIVLAMKEFSHAAPKAKALVDVRQTIENTLIISRNEWKYLAEVETDFDPRMPHISCMPGEISQVILNLVVNAAHAIGESRKDSQDKGTISIATRYVDGFAEIRIRDTGTGIPQEIRDKVFNPFFTTKPVGKGTGQGLALTYRIVVERHNGTIDFESEVGQGTTFIVRLPLDDSKRSAAENESEEACTVCG